MTILICVVNKYNLYKPTNHVQYFIKVYKRRNNLLLPSAPGGPAGPCGPAAPESKKKMAK